LKNSERKQKIREELVKRRACKRFNAKVKPRVFNEGDLIWRMRTEAIKDPTQEKLTPNWEGPFIIVENLQNGAYRLETLNEKTILRTWNANHLKFYFSNNFE